MGNPLALITASNVVNSKEGQKAVGQTVNAAKVLIVTAGVFFTAKYAYSKFKEIRARNFANENIGHPDLIAASIIYESFTRIGYPPSSILSYIFSEINISTDEASLYEIASNVTDIKAVANAYYILYDRNLQEDLQKGTSNKEAKKFWSILNSPVFNQDTGTMYGVGLELFSAIKGKTLRVNKAVQDSLGKWKGTNESYGNFKTGQAIGTIVSNGVWTHKEGSKKGSKENYYIVKDGLFSDWDFFNRNHGVVLQHQITDKES